MNFEFLTEQFVIVVMAACLLIGYVVKNASFMKWLPNTDIPALLALVGAVANVIVSGLSFESVIYGGIMGLASTGLHQFFKTWVEGKKTE